MVGFIGAIDIGIDGSDLVQIEHWNAGGLESRGGSTGTRHRSGYACMSRGELIDEAVHRRSGTDAEYFSFDDEFECCARRRLFSSVLRTHCITPRMRALKRHCPLDSGQCLRIRVGERDSFSLAFWHKARRITSSW